MNNALEEMVSLHRETVALLRETQAKLGAMEVAVQALIATHQSPSALHSAMLARMDSMADALPADRIPMYRDAIGRLLASLPPPTQP